MKFGIRKIFKKLNVCIVLITNKLNLLWTIWIHYWMAPEKIQAKYITSVVLIYNFFFVLGGGGDDE